MNYLTRAMTSSIEITTADLIRRTRVRCGKCSGTGKLEQYSHISSGCCFKCEGSGTDERRSLAAMTTLAAEIADYNLKLAAAHEACGLDDSNDLGCPDGMDFLDFLRAEAAKFYEFRGYLTARGIVSPLD